MSIRNAVFLSVLFVVLPAWIGMIWVEVLKIKGKIWRFLHAWVLGFATMLAAGQLILVPLVRMQQTLTMALMIWEILLTVLALVSFYVVLVKQSMTIRQNRTYGAAYEARDYEEIESSCSIWQIVFAVLALALIFLQAYIPAYYEHQDDDDARFIAEEVSAVVHDTMYQDSPIEAGYMYWDTGEVKKDLTSPWAMYVAMNCKISNIPPAVMSHSYMPFYLIIICYVVYLLIGRSLFHYDMEKTWLFLIVLSVIHLWGYTSTHTLSSMLLLRIWQGKAVCASFILPLFFYVMYQILKEDYERGWIVFLYPAATAACLLSGIGIVTAPIMLFLYGIIDFVYHRSWRKTLAIFMAALPCVVYLGYYLIG